MKHIRQLCRYSTVARLIICHNTKGLRVRMIRLSFAASRWPWATRAPARRPFWRPPSSIATRRADCSTLKPTQRACLTVQHSIQGYNYTGLVTTLLYIASLVGILQAAPRHKARFERMVARWRDLEKICRRACLGSKVDEMDAFSLISFAFYFYD